MAVSYALFETPLGTCGIAWSTDGICRLQLPERDDSSTERRLAEAGGQRSEPPASVREAIRQVVAHLGGAPQSFADVVVDLSCATPFYRRVYEAARLIPSGEVRAYGDVAVSVGQAGAARAVGQALSRNPIPIIVPCHRILSRDGKGGGFSAHGGLMTKSTLLALEGVHLDRSPAPPPVLSLWQASQLNSAVEVLRRDERLATVLLAVGPCTLQGEHPGNPFAALVESIIYQQLAGKVAASIVQRFVGLFGRFPTAEAVLQTPDEVLRQAGLSSAKIAAIQSLSHAVTSRSIDLVALAGQPDDEVRRVLTALKGIGPWTVDMFLIFHLGRPDVFPVGDLGIRKAMQKLYRLRALPDAARMEKLTSRWKPYRTVATWYLWRSLGVVTLGVVAEVSQVSRRV